MRILLFLLLAFSYCSVNAQQKTSTFDTTHSPKKAVFLSAVLPGAGQVYNKKIWKVPIIYAGLGTSFYFLIRNQKQYNIHRDEYLYRINNNGATNNVDLEIYSESNLRTIIDQYQRWRDFSIVAIAGVYALQLVDAAVDGYLWRFDTSDDLSFAIRPSVFSSYTSVHPGIKLRIKF